MSRTIVQEYGPIYGEPVNGTVMGRPNGSVYIPSTNKISIVIPDEKKYFTYYDGKLWACLSDGSRTIPPIDPTYIAESQDLSSNIQMQLFSDSALTTMICSRDLAAGEFNAMKAAFLDPPLGLTDGQTLYLRAQLMSNGTAVATSDTIIVTMVVPE